MNKLLLGGDFHFRSTVPTARKDDYLQNQDNLINWLSELAKDHLIICSGDVVHHARERAKPVEFINYLIKNLPGMWGVLGNHDLLYHNKDFLDSTTMGALINAGQYKLLGDQFIQVDKTRIYGYSYGTEIQHIPVTKTFTNIAVYHGYVTEKPNEFIEGKLGIELLKEFPEYDIILTGDNHQSFFIIHEDRVLINTGSLKRDNADQIDHVPVLYTYDVITKELDKITVPIDDDIIVKDHLEKEQERNERLENLSDKFKEVRDTTLDFEQNFFTFCSMNNVDPNVQSRVLEWLQ